jgi:hypothetical protein
LTFFEKISRNYQENSQAKPKNITLVSIDTLQVAKHDQAEFQPATQTHLDKILTFFQEFSEFFRKTLKQISKDSKFEQTFLFFNKQRMVMPDFSSLPATQTDLDKFLTFFQENFRGFQENS